MDDILINDNNDNTSLKRFYDVHDVANVIDLIRLAEHYRTAPLCDLEKGRGRSLGLLFMNPSLRTRVSTSRAAANLGMDVTTLNLGSDAWGLETRDDIVMDGQAGEHIREAAPVLGSYFDLIGLRTFGGLKDKNEDMADRLYEQFTGLCPRPMINLESALLHPLQSLADVVTMQSLLAEEKAQQKRLQRNTPAKVVLTWAPHCKALPHAVPQSFCQWMQALKALPIPGQYEAPEQCHAPDRNEATEQPETPKQHGVASQSALDLSGLRALKEAEWVVACPQGFELDESWTRGARVTHDQKAALAEADIIYVKNWSGFKSNYGSIGTAADYADWTLTQGHLQQAPGASILHCLPVRRNLVIGQEVLDSPQSRVLMQAERRLYAAQAVLSRMLDNLEKPHEPSTPSKV